MPHCDHAPMVEPSFTWHVPSRLGVACGFQMTVQISTSSTDAVGAKGLIPTPIAQGSFAGSEARVRERVLELLVSEQRAGLWRQHLLDKSSSTDVDCISETVDSVLEAVDVFGPSRVDLGALDLRYANAEHLVAVLRSTFVWRNELPGWKEALAVAPELLQESRLDPELVLKGLDQ